AQILHTVMVANDQIAINVDPKECKFVLQLFTELYYPLLQLVPGDARPGLNVPNLGSRIDLLHGMHVRSGFGRDLIHVEPTSHWRRVACDEWLVHGDVINSALKLRYSTHIGQGNRYDAFGRTTPVLHNARF